MKLAQMAIDKFVSNIIEPKWNVNSSQFPVLDKGNNNIIEPKWNVNVFHLLIIT